MTADPPVLPQGRTMSADKAARVRRMATERAADSKLAFLTYAISTVSMTTIVLLNTWRPDGSRVVVTIATLLLIIVAWRGTIHLTNWRFHRWVRDHYPDWPNP